MKILLIHNFSDVRGGADYCVFHLKSLLEKHGHDVRCFTAEEEAGLLDFNRVGGLSYLYNRRAARKLDVFLKNFHPDVAHCHNIYGHLTPSILPVLKRYKIPVCMTLHDWKLVCPNHRFFTQGEICERCKGGNYYRSLKHRCFKNSWSKSFLGMTEAYLHRALDIYSKNVALFISPSQFLAKKFLECGWSENSIKIIPNFVDVPFAESQDGGEGMIYFGEVSALKGVPLLLQALQRVTLPVKLKIIGDGPDREHCRQLATKISHDVEFIPFQSTPRLHETIRQASFTVVPSLCYENQPIAILESYALGRAVVGTDHGGIAELIDNQKTGLLFQAGNPKMLAEKLTEMLNHPQKTAQMGKEARQKAHREFGADLHYQRIIEAYRGLTFQ